MGIAMDDSAGAFAKFSKTSEGQRKNGSRSGRGKLGTDIFSKLGYTLEDIQGQEYR